MFDTGSILHEIKWKTSRSSGAGGQHVNKVETRVELLWPYEESVAISSEQKEKIRIRLSSYINKAGLLSVVCDTHRSQHSNKDAAIKKLHQIIVKAFKEKKKRIATSAPASAVVKRIKEKESRAEIKKSRGRVRIDFGQ